MSGEHGGHESHGHSSGNSSEGILSSFQSVAGPAIQITAMFSGLFTALFDGGGGGGGHDHHH